MNLSERFLIGGALVDDRKEGLLNGGVVCLGLIGKRRNAEKESCAKVVTHEIEEKKSSTFCICLSLTI